MPGTQDRTQPKIGIRPAIDGRRKGVRESLEAQTMGMAAARCRFSKRQLVLSGWIPGPMCDRGHLHRRRGRSRPNGRKVSPRGGGCFHHRYTLLVLR